MTTIAELQQLLKDTGRYSGKVDGDYGALTRAAILLALTDGPDTALFPSDYAAAAARLVCPVQNIMALADVEASGAGFFAGRPKILFEPHVFSRLTRGRFDATHPKISYSRWGAKPYPASQDARYEQLLKAIELDVDAAFKAASYGKFQILGENHRACGYVTAHGFAFAMARDERTQLRALEEFIRPKILHHLRLGEWPQVARAYNGPAYGDYDLRLRRAAGVRAAELVRAA
jgi:hypothetical protein